MKKFKLIEKTLYTIFHHNGELNEDETLEGENIFFETKEQALDYLVTIKLPEIERHSTEDDYYKVTSKSPIELEDLFYEANYKDEVKDERENLPEDFYIIECIKSVNWHTWDNEQEFLRTGEFYYVAAVKHQYYQEVE